MRSEESRKRRSGSSASETDLDEAEQYEALEEKQSRRLDPEAGALAEALAEGALLTATAEAAAATSAGRANEGSLGTASPSSSSFSASLPPGPPDNYPPLFSVESGTARSGSQLAMPPTMELVDLADLAELAELPDEAAAAALQTQYQTPYCTPEDSLCTPGDSTQNPPVIGSTGPRWAPYTVGNGPTPAEQAEATLLASSAPIQPGILAVHATPSAPASHGSWTMSAQVASEIAVAEQHAEIDRHAEMIVAQQHAEMAAQQHAEMVAQQHAEMVAAQQHAPSFYAGGLIVPPHGGPIQLAGNSLGLMTAEMMAAQQHHLHQLHFSGHQYWAHHNLQVPQIQYNLQVPQYNLQVPQYNTLLGPQFHSVQTGYNSAQTSYNSGQTENTESNSGRTEEPELTTSSSVTTEAHQPVPDSLQEIFAKCVMCNFTPRVPMEFSTSRWASLEHLVFLLQQHAPTEVLKLGHQNIRQLITEWYKHHPAFAGLPYSAWCKRLKDNDPQAHSRSLRFKFSFEYTGSSW